MPPGRARRLAAAGAAAAAVLAYANSLGNALVYDDVPAIVANPLAHDPTALRAVFGGVYSLGPGRVGTNYRPLTVWSFALNWRFNERLGLPGAHPAGFHAVNVGLHAAAAATFLLWLLDLAIPLPAALAAALLFAVHPLGTESVDGIVGRAEVLAALGGLGYLRAVRRGSPHLAALALLLSLWGKESGITYLGLALAADALVPDGGGRTWRTRIAVHLHGAVTAAAWLGLRAYALRDRPVHWAFVDNPLLALSGPVRLMTAAAFHLRYLRLALVPLGLSSDYSYNQLEIVRTPWHPAVLGLAAVAAAAGAAAWRRRSRAPALALAVAGYPVLFAVTSNVLFPIGSTAERFLYSPLLMLALAAGLGLGVLRARSPAAFAAVLAGWAAALAGLTAARNATWHDEPAFYRAQAASAPRSAKAHYNLGCALAAGGRDSDAAAEYRAALAILPLYPEPLYNLGNALTRLGRPPEEAADAYRRAIACDPGHVDARLNLALNLLGRGRRMEARRLVDEAAALDPGHPNLAAVRARLGGAAPSTATGAGPVPPALQRGILAYSRGDHAAAVPLLERALADPALPPRLRRTTLMMLSRCHAALGHAAQAAECARRASAPAP